MTSSIMDVMRVWPEKEPAKQVPAVVFDERMPLGAVSGRYAKRKFISDRS